MSTQLKLRRGTTAQHSTFTGAEGEITVDTTKDTVVVHDGSTAGGVPLAKESGSALSPTSVTLSSGTANGVAYLNGSKVLTTGSALTFDGTTLKAQSGGSTPALRVFGAGTSQGQISFASSDSYRIQGGPDYLAFNFITNDAVRYSIDPTGQSIWSVSGSEQMRLTSTGLGIGTSSPSAKLHVVGSEVRLQTDDSIYTIYSGSTRRAYFQGGSYGAVIGSDSAGILFNANGALRATIDSSGNLGLGVTPSAWGIFSPAIDIGGYGAVGQNSGGGGGYALYGNAYEYASNAFKYKQSYYATLYRTYAGQHQFFTAPSGTAGNAISFTQAMTLDASGNLLVGSTAGLSTTTPIKISAGGSYGTTLANGLKINVFESGATQIGIGINAGIAYLYTPDNTVWGFATNGSERMRIDSSGNLLVGTTSVNGVGGLSIAPNNSNGATKLFFNRNSTAGDSFPLQFHTAGTAVGSISYSNTATAFNTSSDYRLKENIQPMQNALSTVAQLNPVTYTWKADGSDGQGFIAHELQAVVPDCVTGEKDAVDAEGKPVYQGIDTSFLVATLTKAIQEQQEQINQLKAEVATLKGN